MVDRGEAEQRNDFERWLDERPKWLQTAAAIVLATRKKPDSTDIKNLADLCLAEARKTPNTTYRQVPTGAFGAATNGQTTKLLKISNVQGVNAIRSGAELDLGQHNLVIVYGMNGAGKSGFSRLLKNVCGARHREDIHPDVFSTAAPVISADITATLGAHEKIFSWSATGGPIRHLRNIQVFDNQTAVSYVNAKNEATYEPRQMRFLSTLIEIIEQVDAELEMRKRGLPSALPLMPQDYSATNSYGFFHRLKPNLSANDIDRACNWTTEDSSMKLAIENSLKQADIQARLKELAVTKSRLTLIKQRFTALKDKLSDATAGEIFKAQTQAKLKRKVATEDAKKVFANSELEGVGQETWKHMWDQARAYSETLAYPKQNFPVVTPGANCVLCHQPLDDDAKTRLTAFEEFVQSGLEVAAKQAESLLSDLLKLLPELPEKTEWIVDFEFLKLDPSYCDTLYEALAQRLEGIKTDCAIENLPNLNWEVAENAITTFEGVHSKEESTLNLLQKDGKRLELEKQLKELKAREWLSEQKLAIQAEVVRLSAIASIEAGGKLAKTNALSIKKNELAQRELANGYRERFLAELKALGGKRIPVTPTSIQQGKGKISFQLSLHGIKRSVATRAVLSEGENRIVALAAFIADMLGSSDPTPFVFDDPISSLDQEFEELVVDRIIALSKSRQVIVFTHRLSLLALIEDAVKKINEYAAAHGGTIDTPRVISLRRLGNQVGITEDLDARNMKPISGFKILLNQNIPRIKKYHEEGQISDHELAIKATCSTFRILLERSIEQSLLCDVVARFRRSVNSQKIRLLSKMKPSDCAFLDDLMTRYSRHEHSQSMEICSEMPAIEDLIKDISDALAWNQEYEKREVT